MSGLHVMVCPASGLAPGTKLVLHTYVFDECVNKQMMNTLPCFLASRVMCSLSSPPQTYCINVKDSEAGALVTLIE